MSTIENNDLNLDNATSEPVTNSQFDDIMNDFSSDGLDDLLCSQTDNIPPQVPVNMTMNMSNSRQITKNQMVPFHPLDSYCGNVTINYNFSN